MRSEQNVRPLDRTRSVLDQNSGSGALGAHHNRGSWAEIARLVRAGSTPLPAPWEDLFGPLRAGVVDDLVVIGQIGQSIDGRIATTTGRSHYINGSVSLLHLHRLRAVVDAVVVGVGTVCADDPQLSVRHVNGPSPARVVIDPNGRSPPHARLFATGPRTLVVTAEGCACEFIDHEVVTVEARGGFLAPAEILAGLAERGLRRFLIEGGAKTLSYFLEAGCLDRLHIMVAPLILGAGRPGIAFGEIDRLEDALRLPARHYQLGEDVLFDFDLSGARVPVWHAQKSV